MTVAPPPQPPTSLPTQQQHPETAAAVNSGYYNSHYVSAGYPVAVPTPQPTTAVVPATISLDQQSYQTVNSSSFQQQTPNSSSYQQQATNSSSYQQQATNGHQQNSAMVLSTSNGNATSSSNSSTNPPGLSGNGMAAAAGAALAGPQTNEECGIKEVLRLETLPCQSYIFAFNYTLKFSGLGAQPRRRIPYDLLCSSRLSLRGHGYRISRRSCQTHWRIQVHFRLPISGTTCYHNFPESISIKSG